MNKTNLKLMLFAVFGSLSAELETFQMSKVTNLIKCEASKDKTLEFEKFENIYDKLKNYKEKFDTEKKNKGDKFKSEDFFKNDVIILKVQKELGKSEETTYVIKSEKDLNNYFDEAKAISEEIKKKEDEKGLGYNAKKIISSSCGYYTIEEIDGKKYIVYKKSFTNIGGKIGIVSAIIGGAVFGVQQYNSSSSEATTQVE